MKNKLLFIFLLALLPSLSFGQISIDSFKVYHSNGFIDSIYIAGTSEALSLKRISFFPGPGLPHAFCPASRMFLKFEDCAPSPVAYDTMLVFPYVTPRMYIYTVWDSTASCPTSGAATDVVLWDNCGFFTTTNSPDLSQIHLYPNPAQHTVQLELPAEIQVQRLSLSDVSGRILRQYGPQQRSLEVAGLPPGLYFLRVESDRGAVVKRLVVE